MKKDKLIPKRRFREFANNGEWEERKLGSITESFSGGTPAVGNAEYYGGDIPFIRSGEISSDETELFVTEVGLNNSSAKMVKMGDILYALYGATSGEVSISKINGAINQAILAIRSIENDDHYFIAQWLRTQKETIISTYLQGGQGNLSGLIVKELMITLPSNKNEQKKISSFFKNLDNLITLQQGKLKKLKNLKLAYLSEMFPKEGEKYPKRRFAGFTEPWEQRKLGEVGNLKNGMNFSKDAMGIGFPFVNLQNVFGKNEINTSDLGLAEASQSQLKDYNLLKGDVLFVRSSVKLEGVGEAALVPKNLENTTYSGFIIRFRDEQGLDYNFKRYIFSTLPVRKQIMSQATDSANKNISQSVLTNLNFGVPSKAEQSKIGEFFANLDNLITLHQRKLEKLENIKKAYLNEMFV